MAAQIKNVTVL